MNSKIKGSVSLFKILGTIFLIVAVGELIIAGIFFAEADSFRKNAVRTGAVITDKKSGTGVDYTFEGDNYHSSFSLNNSAWEINDSIAVYVNKDNPEVVRPAGALLYFMSIVIASTGSPFLIIGFIFLMIGIGAGSRKNTLLENGLKAWGTITDTKVNYNVTVGHKRHPEFVICRVTHPLTGEEITVKSESVLADLSGTEGTRIPVYFDEHKKGRHYADISSLTEN